MDNVGLTRASFIPVVGLLGNQRKSYRRHSGGVKTQPYRHRRKDQPQDQPGAALGMPCARGQTSARAQQQKNGTEDGEEAGDVQVGHGPVQKRACPHCAARADALPVT